MAARLLLADEAGVGDTLSLAASAMVSALQGDRPVLILCPSTLTMKWQVCRANSCAYGLLARNASTFCYVPRSFRLADPSYSRVS